MAYKAEEEAIATNTITQIEDEYLRQLNDFNALRRSLDIQPGSDTSLANPVCIKTLIVMLYSHYEGFVKYASFRYVELINKLNINTSEVKVQIAAASLHQIFRDMELNQSKCDFFRDNLPDDTVLHRLYRRSNVVEHLQDLWNRKTVVDEKYIDTEANLKYDILCRTLYSIGLDPQLMAPYQGEIGLLLRFRNPIAHGELILDHTYLGLYPRIETAALAVIKEFRRIIMDAIINQRFLYNAA